MKFDPISESVFTDKDEFIKKLSCPYKINWENLEKAGPTQRKCSVCDHNIIDTELFTDNEILKMVNENPATCLKINLNQVNIKLTTNGTNDQK